MATANNLNRNMPPPAAKPSGTPLLGRTVVKDGVPTSHIPAVPAPSQPGGGASNK